MSDDAAPAAPLLLLPTTGIGSLPHTQLELALQLALRVGIPYLPQLPMKDPAELMLLQALEGLPGLRFDREGAVTVQLAEWERRAADFEDELEQALATGAVAAFEPSAAFASAWRPFLWEIESRRLPVAKVQHAGPITARWALELDDGRPASAVPRLGQQIYRLGLVRTIAMARALRDRGATPIVFLDEPALGLLDPDKDSSHRLQLEELRLLIAALRGEGALVGIHCCGTASWPLVLELGADILSFDTALSLSALAACAEALERFEGRGGLLALGLVPTDGRELDLETLADGLVATLRSAGKAGERLLERALLTPACGLALRSVAQCERVFDDLESVRQILRARLTRA
ncbi:MAG: hypothetical protein ACOX6T_22150 [Myxococcales bacterium]|jgi:hypothetical protein